MFYSEASLWDNARWYDPSLGRFAQADPIVPDGVQGLDRYAYVNNNPLLYTDPTGHTSCYGDNYDDGPQCAKAGSPSKGYYDNYKYQNSDEKFEDDGHLYSASVSIGVGPWFFTRSVDIVITDNNQVGVFSTYGTGPGLGIVDSAPWSHKFSDMNDFKNTFMTPQYGATLWTGKLHGDSLLQDVKNYEGTALQHGEGLGPISYEVFSSANKDTKMADGKIWGEALGIGPSVQPAEVHINYSNAIYRPTLSSVASWILGY